jgi:hypothetical protein
MPEQNPSSDPIVIVERIMTMHWDIFACDCWICKTGRLAGCRPREEYLRWRGHFNWVDAFHPGPEILPPARPKDDFSERLERIEQKLNQLIQEVSEQPKENKA